MWMLGVRESGTEGEKREVGKRIEVVEQSPVAFVGGGLVGT